MKNLESPSVAENKQRRKLEFVPPLWPLLVIVVVVVGIALLVKHH